ncbi:transposase [Corallococcus sp. M34]|nr:transposase [Citreicoccus inhibens]
MGERGRKTGAILFELVRAGSEAHPQTRRLHFILDNAATYSSKKALAQMARRVVLHFLPPYCPEGPH